jgi:hypothetical protein
MLPGLTWQRTAIVSQTTLSTAFLEYLIIHYSKLCQSRLSSSPSLHGVAISVLAQHLAMSVLELEEKQPWTDHRNRFLQLLPLSTVELPADPSSPVASHLTITLTVITTPYYSVARTVTKDHVTLSPYSGF